MNFQHPPIPSALPGGRYVFIYKNTPIAGDIFLAGRKGFEPSIFSVTGRRVNRATPPTHDIFNFNLRT